MKIGVRTPSLKKSFKARTTGRINRTLKKSVNPLYGKKGMGYIKNPEKAIYNKVYHKVTVDPLKPLKKGSRNNTKRTAPEAELVEYSFYKIETKEYSCNKLIYILLAVFLGVFGAHYFYSGQKKKGFLSLCFFWTVIPFFVGLYCALVALFLEADSNGNIKIVDKEKIKTDQLAGASEAMKQIEKYSIPLMTTSNLETYSDSLKNTLDNLSKLVSLCEAFPENKEVRALAESVEGMYKGLEGEESNFIKRYYSEQLEISKRSDNPEYLETSKQKLIDSGIFSDSGLELIELLYK
ncbi:MAG: TM2 domain-containing protein [Streptococcus salivarius]